VETEGATLSHDLFPRFDPPASRQRLAQFLKRRASYTLTKSQAIYRNKDTAVYFMFDFDASPFGRLTGHVRSLHFNLNYARPSFFALEADIELGALSAALRWRRWPDCQSWRPSNSPLHHERIVGNDRHHHQHVSLADIVHCGLKLFALRVGCVLWNRHFQHPLLYSVRIDVPSLSWTAGHIRVARESETF
jgi:hypothetical protein